MEPELALGAFFRDVPTDDWTRAVGITDPARPVPFNFGSFLVRGDGRVILIDTGRGAIARTMNMPGGGELPARLAEVGVRPAEIDTIVHTHLHPDHCGWDIDDDRAGERTFPGATTVIARKELEYWRSAAADANSQIGFIRSRLDSLEAAEVIRTFEGEHVLGHSVTIIPTPGHTPGHCSVMLASEGQHLLILGDAAHHPTHLEHPEWIPAADLDPDESVRSRHKVCKLAIDHDAVVTGGHFPILTRGHVRRTPQGYRWDPL